MIFESVKKTCLILTEIDYCEVANALFVIIHAVAYYKGLEEDE